MSDCVKLFPGYSLPFNRNISFINLLNDNLIAFDYNLNNSNFFRAFKKIMNSSFFETLCIVLFALIAIFFTIYAMSGASKLSNHIKNNSTIIISKTMILSSPMFSQSGRIPVKFTCDGENINPPLSIDKIPEGTKSFALIVSDPDAPIGIWFHWVLWNIKIESFPIPEGITPKDAVEGITSFGKPGYGGPCPPNGEHRYFFKLYSLDSTLDLPKSTDAKALEKAMQGHIIKEAEFYARYSRE
jgi:Raf kinase inhibitor-like YbhB/YbcL family protein